MWCALACLGVNAQASQPERLVRWGMPTEIQIYQGKWWGLVTLAFVHQNLLHIAFNLYWFWMIGSAFEAELGSLATLAFVLTSAFVSSGLQLGLAGFGIGLSGVVYALFGFAWVTRGWYRGFAPVANDQVVRTFIGWFFICVIATYTGLMRIGNVAHLSGLLFGMAIGGMVMKPNLRPYLAAGVLAMSALSVVPIFWNPLSLDWTTSAADAAFARRDFDRAEPLFKRALQMDPGNGDWAWFNLASLYGQEGRVTDYKDAVQHLRAIDPEGAKEIEQSFVITNEPETPKSSKTPPNRKK